MCGRILRGQIFVTNGLARAVFRHRDRFKPVVASVAAPSLLAIVRDV